MWCKGMPPISIFIELECGNVIAIHMLLLYAARRSSFDVLFFPCCCYSVLFFFICFVIQQKAYFLFIAWHTWNIFIQTLYYSQIYIRDMIWTLQFSSNHEDICNSPFRMCVIWMIRPFGKGIAMANSNVRCVLNKTPRGGGEWKVKRVSEGTAKQRERRENKKTERGTKKRRRRRINEKNNIDQRQTKRSETQLLLSHTHTHIHYTKYSPMIKRKRLNVCIHFNSLGNHKLCLCWA